MRCKCRCTLAPRPQDTETHTDARTQARTQTRTHLVDCGWKETVEVRSALLSPRNSRLVRPTDAALCGNTHSCGETWQSKSGSQQSVNNQTSVVSLAVSRSVSQSVSRSVSRSVSQAGSHGHSACRADQKGEVLGQDGLRGLGQALARCHLEGRVVQQRVLHAPHAVTARTLSEANT